MQVLLKRNVDKLGRIGDLVEVKPGYARNYLLPLGLAVHVNKGNLAQIEKERSRYEAAERARADSMRQLAATIEATSITIEGRANEEGHLFGSVNAAAIAEALAARGVAIDVRAIRLDQPFKEIGVYDVPVHLHADVNATVKVWVVQSKPA
jgi:large subunit ribosomal protein L9